MALRRQSSSPVNMVTAVLTVGHTT
jgi:hypothetical protein